MVEETDIKSTPAFNFAEHPFVVPVNRIITP